MLIVSLSVRNLDVAGHPSSVHQHRLWDGPPISQWYTRSPQEVTPVIAISNDYSIWGVIPDIPGQTLWAEQIGFLILLLWVKIR